MVAAEAWEAGRVIARTAPFACRDGGLELG
jgi:hypothetical protein